MSYSGTVRCSHCGQSGHNKAGCPKYKERIAQLRARNPDDYYVRQYDAAIAKRAASVKNRRCSYCNEQGHTRAGCQLKKETMAQFAKRNAVYRKNVLDALVKHGAGPGAMVEATDYWGSTGTYLVLGVDWASINMHNPSNPALNIVKMRYISNASTHSQGFALPRANGYEHLGDRFKIVVPTTELRILSTVPADYLNGKLGLKDIFRDKSSVLYDLKDHYGDWDEPLDVSTFNTNLPE